MIEATKKPPITVDVLPLPDDRWIVIVQDLAFCDKIMDVLNMI
jgi:hypothetical protein